MEIISENIGLLWDEHLDTLAKHQYECGGCDPCRRLTLLEEVNSDEIPF